MHSDLKFNAVPKQSARPFGNGQTLGDKIRAPPRNPAKTLSVDKIALCEEHRPVLSDRGNPRPLWRARTGRKGVPSDPKRHVTLSRNGNHLLPFPRRRGKVHSPYGRKGTKRQDCSRRVVSPQVPAHGERDVIADNLCCFGEFQVVAWHDVIVTRKCADSVVAAVYGQWRLLWGGTAASFVSVRIFKCE